ncbi:MAG: MerR family transcriptional regulator [Mobilicoccus sp.]|nr:MerR family transcriptional regulator [Mobilicoccus sp.]
MPSRRSIGRVLDLLRPDFPDVTISKIRFLESEGLVTPERTPAGYRSFSEDDVERLRFVLTAQRDRFWPLKVIREALDARDRGLDLPAGESALPTVPEQADDPDVPSAADLMASMPQLRLTRRELATSAGLDEGMVEALCTYGLLRPDASGHFDAHALAVARAAAGLAAYGLEARHLRPFRTAADREIGLLHQIAATDRRRSAEAAEKTEAQVLSQCIALHTALVKAGL